MSVLVNRKRCSRSLPMLPQLSTTVGEKSIGIITRFTTIKGQDQDRQTWYRYRYRYTCPFGISMKGQDQDFSRIRTQGNEKRKCEPHQVRCVAWMMTPWIPRRCLLPSESTPWSSQGGSSLRSRRLWSVRTSGRPAFRPGTDLNTLRGVLRPLRIPTGPTPFQRPEGVRLPGGVLNQSLQWQTTH